MDERDVRKIVRDEIAKALDAIWVYRKEQGYVSIEHAMMDVADGLRKQAEPVKLNPCRRCGKDLNEVFRNNHYVLCSCGSSSHSSDSIEGAAVCWNAENPLPSKPEDRRFKPGQRFESERGEKGTLFWNGGFDVTQLVVDGWKDTVTRVSEGRISFRPDGWTLAELGLEGWTPVEDGK